MPYFKGDLTCSDKEGMAEVFITCESLGVAIIDFYMSFMLFLEEISPDFLEIES
jgi:hypothetical protein